jgi:glycosyltransferase involved in cell wall biosynthesis
MTVSVVIPCYNAADHVEAALDSVWRQTVPVREVICVDDGSADDTLAVLARLRDRSPVPMRVIAGVRGGAAHARRTGTRAASGDYLQYLDADDILMPEKLAHQMDLVARCPSPPDMIAAAYVQTDGETCRTVTVASDPWLALMDSRLGITSSNLWRRAAVEDAGNWDPAWQTSEDSELVFRMLAAGAAVVVDTRPLTLKRWRPGSLWRSDKAASRASWWKLRLLMAEHLVDNTDAHGVSREDVARFLFPRVRRLYRDDAPAGLAAHAHLARLGLGAMAAGQGRAYRLAYGLLGFQGAERVASWHGTLKHHVRRRFASGGAGRC